jgi:putative ATP-dependent endonuclease of OLD family
MHLAELKLWNFRKYGSEDFDLDKPHLTVPFHEGLNVLIGENDSGKTAIIDAIKLVLKTHAYEWIKVEDKDFYQGNDKLRIELKFKGFKPNESKNFIEWLGWEGEGEKAEPILKLIYQVEKNEDRIFPSDVKGGMDEIGYLLNAEAKEYLKVTFLKALRDADNDLTAKKNSRLSQILGGHELFKKKTKKEEHEFEKMFVEVNERINYWFNDCATNESTPKSKKELIKDCIDSFLKSFISESYTSKLQVSEVEIKAILEKISLGIDGHNNLGLGTMNRLYMAAELLHLKKEWNGLKLCLIEELEAHLHPQAQMKVIEAFQKEKDVQIILTTHSPNLASKVDLDNLIICSNGDVFSLKKGCTKLEVSNYSYLKRFLDVTKSNLFFAKGVILVEGWSEEILIPVLAKRLGYDLTEKEVSIVNVGSTAYLHFAKIFLPIDGRTMNIPVAVITDLDNRPQNKDDSFCEIKKAEKESSIKKLREEFDKTKVKLCCTNDWTLEWCLYQSPKVSEIFKEAVSEVHSGTDEFQAGKFDKAKFVAKLRKDKGTSPLDKVKIATIVADKLEEDISIKKDDLLTDTNLEYLISAIKHACNENNN